MGHRANYNLFRGGPQPIFKKMCFANLFLEECKRFAIWARRLGFFSHQDGWNTNGGQQYGSGEPLQSFFHGVNSFPRGVTL